MNKVGIELSMNFLVIIVLSIVIFGFSTQFVLNLYGKAKGLQSKTFEDLDRQIGFLRCGTEQVCIGDKAKEIRRGEFGVFGTRILNIYPGPGKTKFKVFVRPSSVNQEVDPDYNNPEHNIILLPQEADNANPPCGDHARCEELDPDKSKDFALGVEVNKRTKSGTYVFDFFVHYEDIPVGSNNFKPYGDSPQGKYKINVIVP